MIPFVFESFCSALFHMLLSLSSCYQDGHNRPVSSHTWYTIQRPRNISKKAPYSLKRHPSDTNCYTCSFQDQAYVQRNTMYCLTWAWIPMDLSGLLLEYINLWPLRYMDCLFKRIDVGTHPTMNNTPTFLLIHLAISLLSI